MSLLTRLKNLLRAPRASAEDSKRNWNDLAKDNARYYVLSDYGQDIDEATFRDAGRRDYGALIASDELLNRKLAPFSEKAALEIGCGIGRITEFLAEQFKQVVAVDISEEMIAQARRRVSAPNVSFHATDGVTLPMPDLSADFVFSFIVFQHMPSADIVKKNLAEVARVLKPGGIAKIQLRGRPTKTGQWYTGVAFGSEEARALLLPLPVTLLREEGAGEKYFFLTFEKR